MKEEINQIIIAKVEGKNKIYGNLSRCNTCKINFTAIQPCIICSLIKEKEGQLGRKLNKQEYEDLLLLK